MRFKDVFSIIGPPMVGPSSSHTAGAVKIGRAATQLLGRIPERAQIILFGSFAETCRGHGTDLAIAAGLLNYDTDDLRIPLSLSIAEQSGLSVVFRKGSGTFGHPNTAKLILTAQGRCLSLTGVSIGGGNIEVINVNDFDVKFTGNYPTLVITHEDRPGMIADISKALMRYNMNVASMCNDRKGRSGEAMTVLEMDSPIMAELQAAIAEIPTVRGVGTVDFAERNG